MSFLTGLLVASSSLERVSSALRDAFVATGAIVGDGGERLDVRVGEPDGDWLLVTDSTRYTFDVKVAAHVAETVETRTLVVGLRALDEDGPAKLMPFGPWEAKPKGSKAGTVDKLIRKLAGDIWPRPWQVESRPGVTLSFDVSAMKRSPGPFKDAPHDRRNCEQGEQLDAAASLVEGELRALAALRDRWGWQSAFDRVISRAQDRGAPLHAPVILSLAEVALADTTARTMFERWLTAVGNRAEKAARLALPMLAAVVADDGAALTAYAAKIDDDELRPRVVLQLHAHAPVVLARHALADRVAREQPVAPAVEWVWSQPYDATLLAAVAKLGAVHDNRAWLDRATERVEAGLASALVSDAFELVEGERCEAGFMLLDRALASGEVASWLLASIRDVVRKHPDAARAYPRLQELL